MSKLDLIQKTIYEIKNQIQNNSDVRKLLLYDIETALAEVEVPFSDANDYIVVSPMFDMTEPPFDKNTIISVALVKATKVEEEQIYDGIIKVNILTHSNLWKLADNKIRPAEIGSKLIDLLDGTKFSTSHKLSFNFMELIILNENINGYGLLFFLNEGSGRLGEF